MSTTSPPRHPATPASPVSPVSPDGTPAGDDGGTILGQRLGALRPTDPRQPWWLAAADGVLAGAAAIGGASLLAGILVWAGLSSGTPSPIDAIAGAFIDRTPPWLKNFAVSTFGTSDKLALLVGMIVVLVLLCGAVGLLARRRLTAALVSLAVIGAVGALAVTSRPDAGAVDVLPTVAGTLLGISYLRRQRRDILNGDPGPSRRRVVVGLLAVGAGLLGTRLNRSVGQAAEERASIPMPAPATTVPPAPAAQLDVPGISPFIVPNDDFYRIDTAFVVPHLDAATWSLKVVGEVEQEVSIDWATLTSKPLIQKMVTLTCVSNEVGGDLIGNAVWTGWPVRELLTMAKPTSGADMVLSRSSDGFTAGTPLTAMTDDRDALLAVAMNGKPLPFEHGYPVRLVVPGLYGYVSATKWVTELKVTRFSADQGYWTPRGWSALGPIKTASRIDVPADGASVKTGTVAVAGVAWAQHRGIDSVEVQIDGGAWQKATLAAEPTIDAWRQWVLRWDASAGDHTISVRATDATGAVQPQTPAPPDPDGAQGFHTISVNVQ